MSDHVRERPTSVTIIPAFNFLGALFSLYLRIQMLRLGSTAFSGVEETAIRTIYGTLIITLPVAIGISLALGIGLLYLQSWARVISIVLYLLGSGTSLLRMALSDRLDWPNLWVNWAMIGLSVTFVLILLSRDVASSMK